MEISRTSGGQNNASKGKDVQAIDSHAVSLRQRQTLRVPTKDYNSYLKELKNVGQKLRSDRDQPKVSEKPSWFDDELFENAKSVYERHFMGVNFAHLSGLLLLVRVDSIFKTLSATGQSDCVAKLFKRYYHTVRHVKGWYENDIFDEKSDAYKSLLIVRGMHNKVSSKFNDESNVRFNESTGKDGERTRQSDENDNLVANRVDSSNSRNNNNNDGKVHISEYDVMLTQFAFVGFIVTHAKNVGLIDDFSTKDLESFLHFWRVIGYYLGTSDKFNLCSYELDDISGLCWAIMESEYKFSMTKNCLEKPPGIMSVGIVRSVKFIPMLTVYGMLRYLYELLDHSTREIESRRTWYSNLSYTLIKLVMSRLLGYKPFRSFNNGLTRLSLYLVGKVEDWFSGHLNSKYGTELGI